MSERVQEIDVEGLEARIDALPGIARVREAARRSGVETYIVGGSVRDALLGTARADLDVAVVGHPRPLADALGGHARVHDRFGTATVITPEGPVDIAATRAELYPRPGALPEVEPAGLLEDLDRRDFSINALAVPLQGDFTLIDPLGGVEDLRAATLRALHPQSIADDPTRALRAARYASRLALSVEPETLAQIVRADLSTLSADRVEAELRKLAGDAEPARGFALLADWRLIEPEPGAGERIDAVVELLLDDRWRGLVVRTDAVLAARRQPTPYLLELAALEPTSPSEAVEAARGFTAIELILARALGATWVDHYLDEWRHLRLEISGADLLDAGVPHGPAIGRGLAAALDAKLDGIVGDREEELRVALEAASAPEVGG